MKICNNCGAQLTDSESVCPSCGTFVQDAVNDPQNNQQFNQQNYQQQYYQTNNGAQPNKASNLPMIGMILGIASLLCSITTIPALIISIISLVKKEYYINEPKNKTYAIVGLATSGIGIVFGIIAYVVYFAAILSQM